MHIYMHTPHILCILLLLLNPSWRWLLIRHQDLPHFFLLKVTEYAILWIYFIYTLPSGWIFSFAVTSTNAMNNCVSTWFSNI